MSAIVQDIDDVVIHQLKMQCQIQSIIYTIQKQHDSITVNQINNAIGILQSSRIIQVNDKIASLTVQEKQFLLEVVS